MPIYEYSCEACGRHSTALLSHWSAADPACPHCASDRVNRRVSTFASPRSESGDGFEGADAGMGDYTGEAGGMEPEDYEGGEYDDL